MEFVIESRGLVRVYAGKTRALDGVDVQVKQGEIFGFLGPNGAGKTTFVKILLDFIRPTEGALLLKGEAPSHNSRKYLGYLPERVSIHPFLTPREFLSYQGRLAGLPSQGLGEEIDRCLERVKINEAAERRVGGFSKGMLQRVGLAGALLGRPELLVLDEPNSGLDPIGVLDVREAILEEKKRGATVFLNSHQLLEVEKTCDRVAILNKGRLIAQGSHQELTGEQGLELELEEAGEKVMEYLRRLDPGLRVRERRLELSLKDPETERLLPAKLVELGARINYYAKKRESLEEIFKRVVGS